MAYYQMPVQNWLQQEFMRADRDRSGYISAVELKIVLSHGNWKPFNPVTCRMLISMFDQTGKGVVNFQEFCQLWQYLTNWLNMFRTFDRDNSGGIDGGELQNCLMNMGFRFSPSFYQFAMMKFDRFMRNQVYFDDFVQLCCMLQQMTMMFNAMDTDRDGWIRVNHEMFVNALLHLAPK